ncbi:MAG: FAD-dependent oxidoreductase [Pseudomonadota bacterium]
MLPPNTETPVVILGAGIVGICTALSLLERGVPVTLIDRNEPGQETSMGNAGVVSPWSVIPQSLPGTWKKIPKLLFGYGRPLSVDPRVALKMVPWGVRFLRLGQEKHVRKAAEAMSLLCGPSIELYQKHLRGSGHEGLITDSMYVHAFRDGSRANLNDLDYRIRTEMGADTELVGRNRLSMIEPALSPEFNAAILIKDQARVRSPGRLAKILAAKAEALGASFKKMVIRRVAKKDTGWAIQCDGEVLHSECIVMCLGVWSPGLLKGTDLSMPLMAERGYHVEFADPGIEINNSVMDVDAKVVISSMEGGVRIAGQAEFAPVDAAPNEKRKDQLMWIARSAFPNLRIDSPTFWMGRRPSFPDSLPMLGETPGQPGLYFNFGHSHYGLMMAPKSGEYLAQYICGEVVNANLEPFSSTRF